MNRNFEYRAGARDIFNESQIAYLEALPIETVFENTTLSSGRRCGNVLVRYCVKNGIINAWDFVGAIIPSQNIKGLSAEGLNACEQDFNKLLNKVLNDDYSIYEKPAPAEMFAEEWKKIKPTRKLSLLEMAKGKTCQQIGDERGGISRKAVSEMVINLKQRLMPYANAVAQELIKDSGKVYAIEIAELFNDSDTAEACIYVLKSAKNLSYLKYSNSFVEKLPDNWENLLYNIAEDIVGDGVCLNKHKEEIEDELDSVGLSTVYFEDFVGFLKENGFVEYGNFITKATRAKVLICVEIIKDYFPNGIYLSDYEDSEDMDKLREIAEKEYPGVTLAESNHSLKARIVDYLILIDRGVYCAPYENMMPPELLNRIEQYINNSDATTLEFSELFKAFETELRTKANINNYNHLHGVLKYCLGDEYVTDRDTISIKGERKKSIDERISDEIINAGKPMDIDELKKHFKSISVERLNNIVIRNNEIIKWKYNSYNNIHNVRCSNAELSMIKDLLTNAINNCDSYCNGRMFFELLKEKMGSFVERNCIEEPYSMFSIAEYYFHDEFRFSWPHITGLDYPYDDINSVNIIEAHFGNRNGFTLQEVMNFCKDNYFRESSTYQALRNLKEFVRVSRDEYYRKELLNITPFNIVATEMAVEQLLKGSRYLELNAIDNYRIFPDVGYKWNGYLLKEIIKNHGKKFKIVSSETYSRSNNKNCILRKDDKAETYEELISLN